MWGGPSFSFWEIVKIILLFPFLLIRHFFKVYNPISYTEDNKLIDNLYDLLEEAEKLTHYMGKGPSYLESFRLKNAISEHHIEYKYGSTEFSEQHRIAFFLTRGKKNFTLFTGGNSGGGGSYYNKENINYEELAERVYSNIERSRDRKQDIRQWSNNFHEWEKWREESIKAIIDNYISSIIQDKEMFYYLRRALIMSTHEETHVRYIKAKNELISILNDEVLVMNMVNEIDEAYSGKIVMNEIM
jgi:hypothetical protein